MVRELQVGGTLGAALRVAVLSGHQPANDWLQNLALYAEAAATAKANGAELLLFPEGYGLEPMASGSTEFEPFICDDGATPCSRDIVLSPQQAALSQMARTHRLSIVANVFACVNWPSTPTRSCVSIAFDQRGRVVRSYRKHTLFATEHSLFSPGPFAPTAFDLAGRRFGFLVCFEGVRPLLPGGSWAQIRGLADLGVDTLLWSVGAAVPTGLLGRKVGRKFGLAVLASQNYAAATASDARGKRLPAAAVPLEGKHGGGTATLSLFDLPAAATDAASPPAAAAQTRDGGSRAAHSSRL